MKKKTLARRGKRGSPDRQPAAPTCFYSPMADAAEMLWVVLANVSGGDWTTQTAEWQEAAARWRENYFAVVAAHAQPLTPDAVARTGDAVTG